MNNNKQFVSALALGTVLALGVAGTASAQVVASGTPGLRHFGAGKGHMFGQMGNGVFGTVTAISGNTITVTGMVRPNTSTTAPTYTIDATNAKVEKNGAAGTIASIAVGDKLMVRGTVNGTNVTATDIRDGMPQLGQRSNDANQQGLRGVSGTVTAISGNTITVTGMVRPNTSTTAPTYTIDATNAKVEKNGAAGTIASIAVGDKLMVRGTVNGTNVIATDIRDGMPQLGERPAAHVAKAHKPVARRVAHKKHA